MNSYYFRKSRCISGRACRPWFFASATVVSPSINAIASFTILFGTDIVIGCTLITLCGSCFWGSYSRFELGGCMTIYIVSVLMSAARIMPWPCDWSIEATDWALDIVY